MRSELRLKFSIGFLLFAMLVVAGYFYGLNRGDTDRLQSSLSLQTYSVAPLLSMNQPVEQQIETITKLIRESIAPDSWLEQGGMATLTVYHSNRSFVVNQTGIEHDRIQDLLATLEKIANEKIERVKYDVSHILDEKSEKPIELQLNALCELTSETFSGLDTTPLQISADPEAPAIVVMARGQTQAAIAAHLEQLKFARRAISRIDR